MSSVIILDETLFFEWVKENNLEVTVTDTGIGIAAEMHSAIFDRFRQAEAETTRKYGGTGLGLAIVHKIIEEEDPNAFIVDYDVNNIRGGISRKYLSKF